MIKREDQAQQYQEAAVAQKTNRLHFLSNAALRVLDTARIEQPNQDGSNLPEQIR